MFFCPFAYEHWTHPPFAAHVSEDGFIYARGTQDMKGIGMMNLEAVRNLKNAGVRLKRTVHISFVPDEEIGGQEGMRVFSESEEFKKLNIGFGTDESIPNPGPNVLITFHGERTSRQIKITARSNPGHGALLGEDTAGEKLYYIIDKFMKLRAEEKRKLDERNLWFGDVTTINLTQLEGGVQVNVLPESLSASFDIRIATDVDHDEFEEMILRWCKEAGQDVTLEYLVKNPQVNNTKIDDSNLFWVAIKKAANEM
ncbi:hypothetical protein O3G_MSEX014903 [Manduca sexta]|uniref:Peptidase M20 dimerisation domain-containing protein n=2 Tax=Manduca sexta TaxID=7130 RepID=A0A921ZVA1_MANSE|nr:hypothetical protein O3G_MSEX014903 [Manduca sexta]